MNSNMTFPAPLSALALVGMLALLMLSLILSIGFALARKRKALKATAAIALIAVAGYCAAVLVFSVASETVVLRSGEEKYFCEIDCHLAYSVVSAGYEPDPEVAGDTRLVVQLETRFDPTTISRHRGNGPLTPSPREVVIVDAAGHVYRPAEIQGRSLLTPLRPGEAYRTRLIFEVQAMAAHPLLWLHTKADAPEWMMIGNELSPLHRKVFFQLSFLPEQPGIGSSPPAIPGSF
jgi:hypothetical protein